MGFKVGAKAEYPLSFLNLLGMPSFLLCGPQILAILTPESGAGIFAYLFLIIELGVVGYIWHCFLKNKRWPVPHRMLMPFIGAEIRMALFLFTPYALVAAPLIAMIFMYFT